ncbi:hypothetical protein FJU08_06795 [Martelella alba]|uniref:Uncharacterized protein n=1 Tax=Martelella alba TaxID=2590451 RepID=A0A506UAM2_9HYPH|nr:hypothetical protein [Martelella alba]TPW31462.1 hypothetical protein FJU08_06795 [Martelella alba]
MVGKNEKPAVGKLENFFGIPAAELSYAASTMSVIGGIASAVGFFTSRSENRKILGKLEDIQKYLREMDSKIEAIQSQNREIIQKIDDLPRKIHAIVDEVVGAHLLEEKYAILQSIQLNYFNLNWLSRRRYRINTVGWDRYSEALTYLMTRENRISKLPELLFWCEFALIITEGRAIKVVNSLVLDKGGMVVPLFQQLRDNLRKSHNKLDAILSSSYVRKHNFSQNLGDLSKLKYSLVPDKRTERPVVALICPEGQIPNGGCKEVETTRALPENIKFNENKKRFPKKIKKQLEILKMDCMYYANARDALLSLARYSEIISEDALTISELHLTTKIEDDFEVSMTEPQFVLMA